MGLFKMIDLKSAYFYNKISVVGSLVFENDSSVWLRNTQGLIKMIELKSAYFIIELVLLHH